MDIAIAPIENLEGLGPFLARIPRAPTTLCGAWLDATREITGGTGLAVTARDQGELAAVLPFFLSANLGGGTVANSMPLLGSSGGVIFRPGAADHALERALYDRFDVHLKNAKCRSATIISNPLGPDPDLSICRDVLNPEHEDARMGQATFLDGTEDVLSLFAPRKRSQVRSALRTGMIVRESRAEGDWGWVQRQQELRMKAISGTPKSDAFFDWFGRAIADGRQECRLTVAERNGTPCAGLMTLEYGGTVEYMQPVTDWDKRSWNGLEVLIWESMEHAVQSGRDVYYFGGTWTSQTSLHHFKKQFGAQDVPYHYLTRIYDPSLLALSREEILAFFPHFYATPFAALAGKPA